MANDWECRGLLEDFIDFDELLGFFVDSESYSR
jgi:hypothetical protein